MARSNVDERDECDAILPPVCSRAPLDEEVQQRFCKQSSIGACFCKCDSAMLDAPVLIRTLKLSNIRPL